MAVDFDRIMALIREIGGIDGFGPLDDFYEAGFSSYTALTLLLELETVFDVSIPDDKFIEARTARAIEAMITNLQQDPTS